MSRYKNKTIFRNEKGKRYLKGIKYPIIPLSDDDVFVITNEGDRLDLLAQSFYKNKDLWWVISIANVDLPQNSLYIPVGTQLRIPIDIQSILLDYSSLNI
tara:strand:+ start:2338 stop:2637 length:300 start_codon:yes stop_codon:yes gene_type:complete